MTEKGNKHHFSGQKEKEKIIISSTFSSVILQPTTLCNANCDYCYLPHRDQSKVMSIEVAESIAQSIDQQNLSSSVDVVWHGGEPLATGLMNFQKLISPFENLRKDGRVNHYIQTNGTLVNDRWCEVFKNFDINIGVSIDGPVWANNQRIDWSGKPLYEHIIRGMDVLKKKDIPFSMIAVVNKKNMGKANELYDFFASLGSYQLGINIEEVEGVSGGTNNYVDDDGVKFFWKDLFVAWQKNPAIQIREFSRVLRYASAVLEDEIEVGPNYLFDPFPTVAHNGDVVLLSPELSGINSNKYKDFLAGNVLTDSLGGIIKKAYDNEYIQDYLLGVHRCSDECPYFGFCKGGQASNKYFEYGTVNATETAFCRNSKQRLLDAVIESL